MTEITYRYLSKSDVETSLYKDFIEKYYGRGAYEVWHCRMMWYWQLGDDNYRVFTASVDGEYVGQSCAYRVNACVNQKVVELWWGIDAFVLKPIRGKGVGKRLQKQLHEDCTNFTSAWYSPANGAIKRKCGAKGIMSFTDTFYPVSSFLSISLELVLKKLVSRKISVPRIKLPYFYSLLNIRGSKWMNEFKIKEIDQQQMPSYVEFLESCLKDEPFHIQRSETYLKWKYIDNPRMKCHILEIKRNEKLAGLAVFFSYS